MTMTVAATIKELASLTGPGDLAWGEAEGAPMLGTVSKMTLLCPCGCGTNREFELFPNDEGRWYRWNGDLDHPSVDPVMQMGDPCKTSWALRAGVFSQVGHNEPPFAGPADGAA